MRVVRVLDATDGELIAASRAAPQRFDAVFDRHFRRVYGYLARRVGPDLASDLAAEVFAVAFARRATFEPDRNDAAPWLFGIATNLVRNHRRSEVRQLRAFARTGVDPVAHDRTAEADARVDATRAAPALAGAIASLRPADRDVLLLFAWSGLSYREISDALDVPIGTVRSRLARARRTVRELLRSGGQHLDESDGGDER